MASRRSYNSTPALLSAPTPISPRSYSPAHSSSSSSSSSLSTTSTHTIVPATPRGNRSSTSPLALTKLPQASTSSTSISSNETATPRGTHVSLIPNGNPRSPRQQSKSRTLSTTSSGYSSLPRSHLGHQVSARANPPSTYALIRASLAPYLTNARVTTFVLLFVLVPLLSFVLRMRRRKRLLGLVGTTMAAATSASNAELVRRRLQAAGGGVEVGFFNNAWAEVIRVVGDTVRMAGSGLV